MDFRIFKVKGRPDVLVYKGWTEDCEDKVTLESWFPPNPDPEANDSPDNCYHHDEVITFPNPQSVKRFIKDLTQEAVEEFSNRFSY